MAAIWSRPQCVNARLLYFSAAYSKCLYDEIERVCGVETVEWLERFVRYVPNFVGCRPERTTKPGNRESSGHILD